MFSNFWLQSATWLRKSNSPVPFCSLAMCLDELIAIFTQLMWSSKNDKQKLKIGLPFPLLSCEMWISNETKPQRKNDFFNPFNLPTYFTNTKHHISNYPKNFMLTFSKLVLVRLHSFPILFQRKIICCIKTNWPHFSLLQLFHTNIYAVPIAQIYDMSNKDLFNYLPMELLGTTAKWK